MDRATNNKGKPAGSQPAFIGAFSRWADRLRGRSMEAGDIILISSAIIVGGITGLAAIFFINLLAAIGEVAMRAQVLLGSAIGLLDFMALAGLLVGFIVDRWAREAKGHGVPEVMEALLIRGGRIRPRVAIAKVVASSITIGAGGSAGREGPIVQTGAALGSTLAQLLRFSEERVGTLVASGAAAGIAATFNAPIAGSIFALEVVLGRFTVRNFGVVVMSAVSASIVGRGFLGDRPAFDVPAYTLHSLGELPIYLALGLAAALLAVLFIRLLYRVEAFFDHWKQPLPLKTSLGMVATGLLALMVPEGEVLGPGLHVIGEAIANNFDLGLGLLVAMLFLKLGATTFTLGSGNSGGVFAPALFLGAVLGGIFGTVAHTIFPDIAANPGAYAIVGMAAVFAASARAPITAVLIVFEMSGDYKLILPLLMATVLATLLAEALFAESIYTLKLKLKGLRWQRGRAENILHSVSVEEVMSRKLDVLPQTATLAEAYTEFSRTHHHGMPVVDGAGRLRGLVTISDLDRAQAEEMSTDTPLTEIATPRAHLLVAYPDETIGVALERMSRRGFGRLPVVSREDHDALLGLVRRSSIIRAYQIAISRHQSLRQQAQAEQPAVGADAQFVEVTLDATDALVGKRVADVSANLPADCVLVSINRDGHTILPHGATTFRAGDVVTAFTHREDADRLKRFLCQDETAAPASRDEKKSEPAS